MITEGYMNNRHKGTLLFWNELMLHVYHEFTKAPKKLECQFFQKLCKVYGMKVNEKSNRVFASLSKFSKRMPTTWMHTQ